MVTVTAAVMERDGKVLLARRAAGSKMAGYWEFPGGKLEQGENPRECLRRELREELGIETEIGELLNTNIHEYAHITIELRSYRATHCSGEFSLTVHDEIAWVAPGELLGYRLAPADIPAAKALMRP